MSTPVCPNFRYSMFLPPPHRLKSVLHASIEHYNRARDFAALHRAERLVDVFEFRALADHLVEVESALQVKIDVSRHIDAEAIATHHRAFQGPLSEQPRAVDFHLLPNRDHANDNRGAS